MDDVPAYVDHNLSTETQFYLVADRAQLILVGKLLLNCSNSIDRTKWSIVLRDLIGKIERAETERWKEEQNDTPTVSNGNNRDGS